MLCSMFLVSTHLARRYSFRNRPAARASTRLLSGAVSSRRASTSLADMASYTARTATMLSVNRLGALLAKISFQKFLCQSVASAALTQNVQRDLLQVTTTLAFCCFVLAASQKPTFDLGLLFLKFSYLLLNFQATHLRTEPRHRDGYRRRLKPQATNRSCTPK